MSQTPKREALTYQEKAIRLVFNYVKARLEKTDEHVVFFEEGVYVVWFAKTLQNWKALVSTMLPDGMYYEVTYDGSNQRTYIDAYKKFDNLMITDKDIEKDGGYYKESEPLSRQQFEGPDVENRKDW